MPDVERRLRGLEAAASTSSAVGVLLAALDDPDLTVRRRAIGLAARYVDPVCLAPLVCDGERANRRNAARVALLRQVPISVGAARLLCSHSDPDAVIVGIEVIAAARDATETARILELTNHPNDNVASAALEALGAFPPDSVLPRLLCALGEDGWKRLAAASALGRLKDERAVAPLLELLRDPAHRDVCLRSLGEIGSPIAIDAVLDVALSTGRKRTFEHATRALCSISLRSEAALSLAQPRLARLASSARHEDLLILLRGGDWRLASAAGLVLLASGQESTVAEILALGSWREYAAPYRGLLAGQVRRHGASLLGHRDARVRASAIEISAEGDLGMGDLLKATTDCDTAVRSAAFHALGRLRDVRATERLLECLAEDEPDQRVLVAQALVQLGDGTADAFARALKGVASDDVLAALLHCAPAKALDTFQAELPGWARHRMVDVRLAAVRAVARRGDEAAHSILHDALSDSEACVSTAAAEALATFGLLADIMECLSRPSLLRFRLIAALARPGLHAATMPLMQLYDEAATHEQVEIVTALGRIGGDTALTFLSGRAFDPEPAIRRVAAEALAQCAAEPDTEILLKFAVDPEWSVRRWAVAGLARVGGDAALDALRDLARDTDDLVASSARAVLIGPDEALS